MLKTIPPALTPDLLWILAAMGHGDRLVLANANYPAYAWHARHARTVPLPGLSLVEATRAIAQLMPVDDLAEAPVHHMVADGELDESLAVHRDVQQVLEAAECRPVAMKPLSRAEFLELAATAFATVHTTDNRPYGCFVIAKGVVRNP